MPARFALSLILLFFTLGAAASNGDALPAPYLTKFTRVVRMMKTLASGEDAIKDGLKLPALVQELNISRNRMVLRSGLTSVGSVELSGQAIDWLEDEVAASRWNGNDELDQLMDDPVLTNMVLHVHIQLYLLRWASFTRDETARQVLGLHDHLADRFQSVLRALGSKKKNVIEFEAREKIPFSFLMDQAIGPESYPDRLKQAKCARLLEGKPR